MVDTGQIASDGYASALRTTKAPEPGEAWRKSTGSARTLRYVSLLYTCFFFIEPYYRHSVTHWLWFGAFYVLFLALYFAIARTEGRTQKALVAAMFVLGYIYFPFNESASGAFVYPAVIMAFMVRRTSTYIVVVLSAVAGIMLETWLFHDFTIGGHHFDVAWWSGGMGAFFCVVVGFSNLAYSRQQQASFMLQRANDEIEHLAQVAERERIARDLHDLLGHTLTVIAIKSELANRLLERDPARAKQEMLDVEQTARKALADVREAVAGYRSEGLNAEISRARRTLLSAEVTLNTSIANTELTAGEANVLCLCLREAVTNIVRHAHATTCDVQLVCTDTGLCLSIDDNGTGCSGSEGNGLRGMRERIASMQGKLRVISAPDGGTHLTVTLPSSSCATRSLDRQRQELPA
jgi:two-component system sensor histidine kinase DesK